MKRRVNVIGVGMTKFAKPGASDDYHVMAKAAGLAAMKDAGIQYSDVEQAFCGYVYGDSTCGQRAVYELGLTGIPVVNVNNNCSTGSTALYLAAQNKRADCAHLLLQHNATVDSDPMLREARDQARSRFPGRVRRDHWKGMTTSELAAIQAINEAVRAEKLQLEEAILESVKELSKSEAMGEGDWELA